MKTNVRAAKFGDGDYRWIVSSKWGWKAFSCWEYAVNYAMNVSERENEE